MSNAVIQIKRIHKQVNMCYILCAYAQITWVQWRI